MYNYIDENIKYLEVSDPSNYNDKASNEYIILNNIEELIDYLNNSIYDSWKFANMTYSKYSNTFYGYIDFFINGRKESYSYLNILTDILDMDMVKTVRYDFGKIVDYKINMMKRNKSIDYFIN